MVLGDAELMGKSLRLNLVISRESSDRLWWKHDFWRRGHPCTLFARLYCDCVSVCNGVGPVALHNQSTSPQYTFCGSIRVELNILIGVFRPSFTQLFIAISPDATYDQCTWPLFHYVLLLAPVINTHVMHCNRTVHQVSYCSTVASSSCEQSVYGLVSRASSSGGRRVESGILLYFLFSFIPPPPPPPASLVVL